MRQGFGAQIDLSSQEGKNANSNVLFGNPMPSHSNEESYKKENEGGRRLPNLLKLSLLSASSAVLGGIAVAWWHRKTLASLQNPIVQDDLQKSESSQEGKYDEE